MKTLTMKILGLDHVVIRDNDIEPMIAFYRDVLGCEVERSLEDFGLHQLRAGNSLIDLVDVTAPIGRQGGAGPGDEGRNMDHFCLRIDDFDETLLREHLASHGVEAGETGQRYGADGTGPSIYIRDPEGNVVELKGPPTSS